MRQEQACDFAQGLAGVNATDFAAFFTGVTPLQFVECFQPWSFKALFACHTYLLIIQKGRLHLGQSNVGSEQFVKVLSLRLQMAKDLV